MTSIAIIGSGPMGVYVLHHLTAMARAPLAITIFEASAIAGFGMPYDPALNADYMLCNAFSREIPAPVEPLIDWLESLPKRELSEWELSTHDLSPRAFYPRVLIGEYLQAQFDSVCRRACAAGHSVKLRTETRVADIVADSAGELCVDTGASDREGPQPFDIVVIASGHKWPDKPEIDGVPMLSPWPYTNLTQCPDKDIGILGSSLSAIDVVVALGHARGSFDDSGDTVSWTPKDGNDDLRITMVSLMGVMPEADFYYRFPYEPLVKMTGAAVDALVAQGAGGLLDRIFALLCDELDAADPGYLARFPAAARTVEGFADSYFAHRRELGGLDAVKRDLAKARATLRAKETIPHRYALLRGHERFDAVLRKLSEDDYKRFLDHLMPVFADCYAAVPHLSLARVIAMYDAGVLDLAATCPGAKFSADDTGQIGIETDDGRKGFAVLIDARGQAAAGLDALDFPRLVDALASVDAPLVAPFRLERTDAAGGAVYCLALPQLLVRHPFSQGLGESHDHAKTVAEDIVGAIG